MSSNDNINLSAAIRQSLITLQGTQTNINTTQNDLATGLKVNNAVDNPVAYFQAAALTDRASDFSQKKDGIDQGISSLSTALEGINGVEAVVQQLQGLVLSAQSSTPQQIGGIVTQYNTLRSQINTLATDTTYQGLNLIAGTGQVLTVSFSNLTASNLTVDSVDITDGPKGLNIAQAVTANGTGFELSFNSNTGGSVGALSAQTFYFSGTASQLNSGTYTFSYGSATLTVTVGSAGSTTTGFTTTSTLTDGAQVSLQFFQTQPLSASVVNGNSVAFEYGSSNGSTIISSGSTVVFDVQGLTGTTLASGTYTFAYGDATLTFAVGSAGSTTATFTSTSTFTDGTDLTLTLGSAGGVGTAASLAALDVNLGSPANGISIAVEYAANTAANTTTGSTIVVDLNGLTGTTLASGSYSFTYGTATVSFFVYSAGSTSGTFTSTQTFINGADLTLTTIGTAGITGSDIVEIASASQFSAVDINAFSITVNSQKNYNNANGTVAVLDGNGQETVGVVTGQYVLDSSLPATTTLLLDNLQNDLADLRTQAQTVGSNVALLNTRLDFTNNYINLLTQGSGKLTLADLNEEGANLLSLQTAQQLGIQALSFAGQSERAVLSLFR